MQGLAKQSITIMSRLHKVDIPTLAPQQKDFFIMDPQSDGKSFKVGDLVSNGTQMRGRIKGFEVFLNEENGLLTVFVNHTWSGVGMGLEDIHHIQELPCKYQFGDPVLLYFVSEEELTELNNYNPVPDKFSMTLEKVFTEETDGSMKPKTVNREGVYGRIHAIHFLPNKIKYDVDLSFTGGANTRFYNVEEKFIFSRSY